MEELVDLSRTKIYALSCHKSSYQELCFTKNWPENMHFVSFVMQMTYQTEVMIQYTELCRQGFCLLITSQTKGVTLWFLNVLVPFLKCFSIGELNRYQNHMEGERDVDSVESHLSIYSCKKELSFNVSLGALSSHLKTSRHHFCCVCVCVCV
jgi:hypothetical protein